MSELEKTAPNEIYLIVGDTDKDCNFNELEEVTWADMPIYEETAIKYVKSSQLTIPKSIADALDEIPNEAKEYVRVNDFGEYSVLDDFVELREFYEADEDEIFPKFMKLKDFVKDNLNLCVIYLAGKALGVDLVKVVEG